MATIGTTHIVVRPHFDLSSLSGMLRELADQIDAMGARLGAEEGERMRIVDGDGNMIRETVTEVE